MWDLTLVGWRSRGKPHILTCSCSRSGRVGHWDHLGDIPTTRSWRPGCRPASEAGSENLLCFYLGNAGVAGTQVTCAVALRIILPLHRGRYVVLYFLIDHITLMNRTAWALRVLHWTRSSRSRTRNPRVLAWVFIRESTLVAIFGTESQEIRANERKKGKKNACV